MSYSTPQKQQQYSGTSGKNRGSAHTGKDKNRGATRAVDSTFGAGSMQKHPWRSRNTVRNTSMSSKANKHTARNEENTHEGHVKLEMRGI